MTSLTRIEWTDATWNPIAGCNVVSPGCTNCYAMRQAHRLASNPATPHYHGTTQMTRGGPVWTGKIGIAPEAVLTAPLRRKKPTTYFVNSMSDLFHEGVPDEVVDRVFAVMALCPQHRFQILTKRPDRMQAYASGLNDAWHGNSDLFADRFNTAMDWNYAWINDIDDMPWPLPNVWLGTSVEDQRRADERIPHLLATPAAVRFISAEPLLGPLSIEHYLSEIEAGVDLSAEVGGGSYKWVWPGLDWVIVGGESGPGARPMHPDWARALRDQCQAAGVSFFFKQWGAFAPTHLATPSELVDARRALILSPDGRQTSGLMPYPPDAWVVEKIGKRAAGRVLDGRTWDEVPG